MGNDYLCGYPRRVFGLLAASWAAGAWAVEEEPAWMARAPEIKFQKLASYTETSLQQSVVGIFGYSLGVRGTVAGRSELSGGPLIRPLKGLEIGLERAWDRSAKSRDESLMVGDSLQLGAEFDHRGTYGRPQPLPLHLGHTGPVKYELHGSRLRVKYYIDEHTVLSMRARYSHVEQKTTVWLWLETRF